MVDKPMNAARKIALGRPTTGQIILMGVGLVLAIVLFISLQGFVACWRLTALPGMAPSTCVRQETITNPEGTPLAVTATPTLISAPQGELPAAWDGASRVTILFVGLDERDWEKGQGTPHTDTMILLTVDPLSKTAGMLSIPRDLWVNIPGFGYNKINSAYKIGGDRRLSGGGRALAEKTVENFLGVNIDYFVQVDFDTFIKVIDDGLGGIDVDVPYEIVVGLYKGNGGVVTLEPGLQPMTGRVALGYARNRYTEGGDVDRANRQQQVILAIRDKVISNLPSVIGKAPILYQDLSAGISTDISLPDALRLAILVAKDIPLDSIQKGVIDYTMMEPGTATVDGQKVDILRPYPDKIRELVDRIFGGGAMKPMAEGDPTQKMQAEAARVVVVNGTGVNGMAERTSTYLTAQGMNVIDFGNTFDYPDDYYSPFPNRTIIILHTGKPYAMQYLKALMQFNSSSQIRVDFDPSAPEDIIIALGVDWGGPP